jgi:hypothetical protein
MMMAKKTARAAKLSSAAGQLLKVTGAKARKTEPTASSYDRSAVAAQKFINDVQIRGEAAELKNGKLPLGKTHILKKKRDGSIEVERLRFDLTG